VLTTYFEQSSSRPSSNSSSKSNIIPNIEASRNGIVWDPPFEDANDVIIRAICARAAIEPMAPGIPAAERRARFKKLKWSDTLNSTTHSNAYEVVHPRSHS
jgi:hypothetical protein